MVTPQCQHTIRVLEMDGKYYCYWCRKENPNSEITIKKLNK